MSNPLRLFFALWPDDVTRSALARLQFDLTGQKALFRNLHVTLAFLGEQDASLLPVLQEVLTQLDANSMQLEIDRRGHFSRNRIAWAGMQHPPLELTQLQENLVLALRAKQISFADNAIFKPHITLAREADAPPALQFPAIHWHVKHVALVQSLNTADGLQYDVLASKWLKKV